MTRVRSRSPRSAPDGREGLVRARRLRPHRAQPRARPARLRRSSSSSAPSPRRSSRATTSSCSTAARARTTARWRTSARPTARLIAVGFVPLGRLRARGARRRRGDPRSAAERSWCPSAPPRRQSPHAPRLRRRSGPGSRTPASRSCCTSAAAVGRLRRAFHNNGKPGHRLPGRRREHPRQGLHGHPPRRRRSSSRAWCSTASSSSFRACAAAASSRARMWVVPWLQAARHRADDLPAHRAGAATAADGVRVHPGASVVHAVPDRAGRLDDRAGGRRPLPVLVGLPAPRGHARSRSAASSARSRASPSRRRSASMPRNFAEMMSR